MNHEGATTTSSVINLMKTLIGSGLLAMPLAFKTDGYLLGTFIIAAAAVVCGFGFYLQGRVSKYVPSGKSNFFLLCELTFPSLAVIFDAIIAFNCFGGCLSYWVLIGDLMPNITGLGTRNLWIGLSLIVIVPLCLLKRLDALKFTSLLALGAVTYIVIIIIAHFIVGVPPSQRGSIDLFPPDFSGTVGTFPILLFAFSGHQNMFTLINELQDKSMRNITRVITYSVGISCAVYIAVGLAGYFTFGDKVQGNIMVMYGKSVYITVAQISLSLMCHLSIPLMFHPSRESVHSIYRYFEAKCESKKLFEPLSETEPLRNTLTVTHGSVEEEDFLHEFDSNLANELVVKHVMNPVPARVYYTLSVILLALGYTLALCISSFALVLEIIGSTGCTSVALIFPGLFGYKLLESSVPVIVHENDVSSKNDTILKYASLAMVIFGFLVMFSCLYALVVRGEYTDSIFEWLVATLKQISRT
ncbi:hypothetical protein BABINDRAFT_174135 [Babjeviella inositovora NRRL Y-12698]|uniref:Amino acid transporter transmembrane domain-containing protein n=1 Tax=Babjeviella inositovora NRRL Y-12698 TaxID=984486 RepID=A0A1E3QWP0_9ASCO|nr:uncharacterized protein BABINDRAFT_174135 [Babjeviella inositovora NRRL Y-12698]ODQ81492.1 hypothetical protein BABINDRAFT_174135 [Babjeviella inositovora NRRL Y-12698]